MTTIQVRTDHLTSREVALQIAEREEMHSKGVPLIDVPEISDAAAVTIASWWQSPGTIGRYLASLASGAPVDHNDLLDDIEASRRKYSDPDLDIDLDYLATWVINKSRITQDQHIRED